MYFSPFLLGPEAPESPSLSMSAQGFTTEPGAGLSGILVHFSAGTGSHFSPVSYVLPFVGIDYHGDLFSALLHKCLHGVIAAVFQEG